MSNTDRPVIVAIKDLTYIYRGNWMLQRIKALDAISLQIFEGEAFGFLGHNGAGKTTCIKCMLGLVRPQSGSIELFGTSNKDITQRRLIGYLPEQPYFYDHLTVDELMFMYARLSGLSGSYRETKQAVDEALDLVSVAHRRKAKMRQLSKGLTQRVALAQAIVARPRLLIVDEPFSGLDPIGRKEFRDLFMRFKSQGTSIFMSSHILSDVEFLCDRASIMAKGSIKALYNLGEKGALGAGEYELVVREIKPIQSLLETMQLQYSTERTAGGDLHKISVQDRFRAEQLLQQAIQLGCAVESFNFIHARLEELFVKIMHSAKIGRE